MSDAAIAATRLLLVAHPTRRAPEPGAIRRYRLARLRLDSGAAETGDRFEHLKRTYD